MTHVYLFRYPNFEWMQTMYMIVIKVIHDPELGKLMIVLKNKSLHSRTRVSSKLIFLEDVRYSCKVF